MEDKGAWCQAMELCRSIYVSILRGQGPYPGSSDWNVAKASFELIVRWGIYQELSPGVGIHLRFSNNNRNRDDVSSAIRDFSKEVNIQDHPQTDEDQMFQTLEFLMAVSLNLSPNATHIREFLLSHHLPDLWAACLELGFGPKFKDPRAEVKLEALVNNFPVKSAVESIFVLLRQENCPGWFKLEAGKVLSRLVMRDGGVAAVMEVLVGNTSQGTISVQRKVASQVARSPTYVATSEEYYRNICPQVLQLLALRSHGGPENGIVDNIHQTSVVTACILVTKEPRYTEEFMLKPLHERLLVWGKAEGVSIDRVLYETILQIHTLIRAGHEGFKRIISGAVKEISTKLQLLDQGLAEAKRGGFQDTGLNEAEFKEFKAAINDVLVSLVVQPIEEC